MSACPFCAIVDGRRQAHRVYADEHVVAILDANPAVRGHTLVLPREHRERLLLEAPDLADPVYEAVQAVITGMRSVFDPDGVSLFYTSADIAGTIAHAHVHVLPRFRDDDVRLALPREALTPADAADIVGAFEAAVGPGER